MYAWLPLVPVSSTVRTFVSPDVTVVTVLLSVPLVGAPIVISPLPCVIVTPPVPFKIIRLFSPSVPVAFGSTFSVDVPLLTAKSHNTVLSALSLTTSLTCFNWSSVAARPDT